MTLQKITRDMPEPEEFGSFLVWEDSDNLECLLTHLAENDIPWIDAEAEWDWPDIRITYLGYEIESLAGFERRIRREALDVTDAECDVFATAVDGAGMCVSGYAIREGLRAVAVSRERRS
jgi:hypothetical protein